MAVCRWYFTNEKSLKRNASALLKVKLTGSDQGELLRLWGLSEGITTFAMEL
jgi:hypothetical protein